MTDDKDEQRDEKGDQEVGDDDAYEKKNGEPKTESSEEKGTEKPAAEKKKQYVDWPLKDVKEPHENDVLYGRGGGTNHHPGNKRYRKMVEERKKDYINSKRLDKPLVALEIIRQWRAQEPPGRFLKMDEKSGLWNDVGDKKAREKTSQALREKAPDLRKKQEEEEGKEMDDDDVAESTKSTRFAQGTNMERKSGINRAVLARDHSLGREYLEPNEAVTLDGFSWREGVDGGRTYSTGSIGNAPPYPPGRVMSTGSAGVAPPYFPPSRDASTTGYQQPPPPPPPDPYYREMSGLSTDDQRTRYNSSGRYESWGRIPSMGSIGSMNGLMAPPPPPMPYASGGYQRSGSYGPNAPTRENSMSRGNPLRDATLTMPATPAMFGDSRSGSGYWGPETQPAMPSPPPPPHYGAPPNGSYRSPPRYRSGGRSPPPYGPSSSRDGFPHKVCPTGGGPNSPYNIDPEIAQTWSSQSDDPERGPSMFPTTSWAGMPSKSFPPPDSYRGPESEKKIPTTTTGKNDCDIHARPEMKRMTSNANEDVDTKPDLRGSSVKRAALNRDNSAAANALKETYIPEVLKNRPIALMRRDRDVSVSDQEMNILNESLSKLKPHGVMERKSTMDEIGAVLTKPLPLDGDNRDSAVDAIPFDLEVNNDDLNRPPASHPRPMPVSIPKPPVVRTEGRMSTDEYLDIVNEPLHG